MGWKWCSLLGWLEMSLGVMEDDALVGDVLHVHTLIHQILDTVHHLVIVQELGEDCTVLLQVVNG